MASYVDTMMLHERNEKEKIKEKSHSIKNKPEESYNLLNLSFLNKLGARINGRC